MNPSECRKQFVDVMPGDIKISRRKIIVVDDTPSTGPTSPRPDRYGEGTAASTSARPAEPTPSGIRTKSGHIKPGLKFKCGDGTLYQSDACGALRRLTPKPLSKKALRRKTRHGR